jgi:PAS domain S-box-containing protein
MMERCPRFENRGPDQGATMTQAYDSPEQILERVRTLDVRLLHMELAESERRRAMTALLRSEELNRRILEAVPGGVVVVAADGSIQHANAEARRLSGLSWEKLSARHVTDWDQDTIREDGSPYPASEYPITRCLQTGRPQPAVTIGGRRADGQIAWAIVTAIPLPPTEDGRPGGAVATFLDITERKRVEQALRESEERHRVISELTADYAYGARVEPDGRVVLEWATEGFEQVTGYTVAEWQAAGDVFFFLHPDEVAAVRERMERYSLAGRPHQDELRIRTKAGDYRWIHYSTLPVAGAGPVVRLFGAAQDVTERKRAEEQLRALSCRLLEVQEQERRHLACELHDEIGQNLTGLKLTLEYAQRLDGEELRGQLAAAQRLLKDLTERVRDLSLRLRPTMLDDLGLVPALLWHFERYTAQTQVRVVFEHGPLTERFAPAVETGAYRIVQEALTNVARHAGVREATVRLWTDDETLGIQVEDPGRGFDICGGPAAGSSGLSGMQERARLLGGQLEIESMPGAGTRLTALLPLRNTEEAPPHGPDPVARR